MGQAHAGSREQERVVEVQICQGQGEGKADEKRSSQEECQCGEDK